VIEEVEMESSEKNSRPLSFGARSAIVSVFLVGIALLIFGTVAIAESRDTVAPYPGLTEPPLVYVIWDEFRLVSGIVLALLGTAMSSASLTYATLRRKSKKGFGEGQ
jgi:hypothetical protein